MLAVKQTCSTWAREEERKRDKRSLSVQKIRESFPDRAKCDEDVGVLSKKARPATKARAYLRCSIVECRAYAEARVGDKYNLQRNQIVARTRGHVQVLYKHYTYKCIQKRRAVFTCE